jgi:hypothetical protein
MILIPRKQGEGRGRRAPSPEEQQEISGALRQIIE